MERTQKQIYKKKATKILSIYSKCLITRNIVLPITSIGKNLMQIIEQKTVFQFQGKCINEGFVKPDSIHILTYSSGIIQGIDVSFEVVFECEICCPVEGMLINCRALNITKAGIRAESADEVPNPIVVFISRDHHSSSAKFSEMKEGDVFVARVIGQRFELNDKYVSIIASMAEKDLMVKEPTKPKLVFED